MEKKIIEIINHIKGDVGFYYKDLYTGKELSFQADNTFIAASIIKLPLLITVLKQCEEKRFSLSDKISIKQEDKVPGCGALYLFEKNIEVSIETLCRLMIAISDNTATNALINQISIPKIKEEFQAMGLEETRINRLLFDSSAKQQGKENYFTPREMGQLLEKVYHKELVSPTISEEVKQMLLLQQINHKIPQGITEDLEIAHKTGEDDGISHDVGIVYGQRPFIIALASNHVAVRDFEERMREITGLCYALSNT